MEAFLVIEIPENEAEALAQFVKRICFSNIRELAKDDDEAYQMQNALTSIRESLTDSGYNPR